MFLQHLQLQQFRCFEEKQLLFTQPLTLLIGDNGAGKTSIIEAVYYLSYFKSFRSHMVSDLMYSGTDSFFLKGTFSLQNNDEQHDIQVGYSQKKKSIKFDQKQITSYKEVLSFFQVITLTEDDIDLIKGYPAHRRSFIDQAVLLHTPQALDVYKEFKQILHHRNALLERFNKGGVDKLEFEIWTQKLWEASIKIQNFRKETINKVQIAVNQLIAQFFDGIYRIDIGYDAKMIDSDAGFDSFWMQYPKIAYQEQAWKRSMFGAHLDDLVFQIRGQKARIFASRGQQKLISLLCKLSLMLIQSDNQLKPLLLIDDFISDFDAVRLGNLINFFLSCQNQIIMTTPILDLELKRLLGNADLQRL